MKKNILQALEEVPCGLERTYFLQDHRQEIERELALHGPPVRPWNDEEKARRWPHYRRGAVPTVEGAAARSTPNLNKLNTLNGRERAKFYMEHRTEILSEAESFREGLVNSFDR